MKITISVPRDTMTVSLEKGEIKREKSFPLADLRAFLIRRYFPLVQASKITAIDTRGVLTQTFDWGKIYAACEELWLPLDEYLEQHGGDWKVLLLPTSGQLF